MPLLPSPSGNTPRSHVNNHRWHFVLVTCLLLTLFNVMGTRHATRMTTITTTTSLVDTTARTPLSLSSSIMSYNDDHLHSGNYRLDPTRLQRQTQHSSFAAVWQDYGCLSPSSSSSPPRNNDPYPLYYNRSKLTLQSICGSSNSSSSRGGDAEAGLEGPHGQLLLNKVQIANTTTTTMITSSTQQQQQQQPRLLCAIYTHPLMHQLARAAAVTWGRHCDGWIALTLETRPDLGFLHLQHAGPEAYQNMWQKTRKIWQYMYQHYAQEYDLFHLGGDDMYVIPENLKLKYTQILHSKTTQASYVATTPTPPIFLGQWVPHGPNGYYVGGGGGYTLNQPALRALVEQALPHCHVNTTASFEDRLITKCLRQIGIEPSDTRDPITAEQTYHDHNPQSLFDTVPVPPGNSRQRRRASFHAKAAAYWETLPHPSLTNNNNNNNNTRTGPRTGLQAAAVHSVSFHKIHYPDYMVRIHVLLRPELCRRKDQS